MDALLSAALCASFIDVEHACQQCGTTVEDGRPFCPQCRAPQIHVQIAIADTGIALASNPLPDASSADSLPVAHSDRTTSLAGTMDRGTAVRAALKAGVLGFFIGIIPFLGIALTGALAVFLYRRENGILLPGALGARLGAAAGGVAFAINSAIISIRILVFHAQQQSIDDFMKVAQRFGANVADPDMQVAIHYLFTPQGLAVTLLFGMIFAAALASIGGALASLLLRPSDPRR